MADDSTSSASARQLFERGLVWTAETAHRSSPFSSGDSSSSSEHALSGELTALGSSPLLSSGLIHEWFLEWDLSGTASRNDPAAPAVRRSSRKAASRGEWFPPLWIISGLIGGSVNYSEPPVASSSALSRCPFNFAAGSAARGSTIAWVGKRCFPTPELLAATLGGSGESEDLPPPALHPRRKGSSPRREGSHGSRRAGGEHRCLFIDPPDTKGRLWAIERLLRSPAVGIVVGDGSAFSLIATRKLQLAARVGGGTAFLARPPWELSTLSTAHTRWVVKPVIDPHLHLPNSLLRRMEEQHGSSLSARSNLTYTAEERRHLSDSLLWELVLVRARGYPTPMQWQAAWIEDASDEKGSLHITVGNSSRDEIGPVRDGTTRERDHLPREENERGAESAAQRMA